MAYDGFLTLTLRIEALTEGLFRATTSGGPRGAQSVDFELPLTSGALETWLEQFRQPFDFGQPDRWRLLEQFGVALFDAVFQGENLATWRVLHDRAQADNLLLRLVLELSSEELYPLPWEALFDPTERFFLARDPHTCIIRFPRDPARIAPHTPRPPLRILGLISNPEGVLPLDVAGEKQLLETALHHLIEEDEITISWIGGEQGYATLTNLAQELTRASAAGHPYHILHYIGHAAWDDEREEGVLLLENRAGQPVRVTALTLGELLRGGHLRLAVLNACEGSRVEQATPFRSVAAALTSGADLPAVIANQIQISDEAAKAFAEHFYTALAERQSIEEGMVAARRAMALPSARNPEWVASVLFSRYREDPIRLLPQPFLREGHPFLTATILFLLTTIIGVTVVSMFRVLGVLVGAAFQVGVWALAAWFAYDRRVHLLKHRYHVLSSMALATVVVVLWFLVYQPTLEITAPPGSFGLVLEHPSPLAFQEAQVVQVNYSLSVVGRVINVPEGHTVWLLVQAENSATYVVGDQAVVDEGGRFVAAEVVVGPPAIRSVGDRRYTIQPVLVNEAGHRFLQRHRNAFWRFFHPDFRVVPEPRLQNAVVIRR